MADNLTQPLLIVKTKAQVAGQISPAMSQSSTASYASGQTLNQTLMLRAGQSYSPNIGFSNLVINTTGPVKLVAAVGSNPTAINQTINQQTTIDSAVDSFVVTNSGTTSVTVKMTIVVAPNTATTPVGVVTSINAMLGDIAVVGGPGINIASGLQNVTVNNTGVLQVNGLTGNVSLSASTLPGLATVAVTGRYSDLVGIPVVTSVVSAPTTGQAVTIAQATGCEIVQPAGPLAALTVNFPVPSGDGHTFELTITQSITALTLVPSSGVTIVGGLTSVNTYSATKWRYVASTTTWYLVA